MTSPLSSEELRRKLESGELSLGCPLPEGFKPMSADDRARLSQAMLGILEKEKNGQ